MDGCVTNGEGINLNTLLKKELENLGMLNGLVNTATTTLHSLTFDDGLLPKEKPDGPEDNKLTYMPLMGGISEVQKVSRVQMEILAERITNINRILFG
jgi:hypothetical protein